MLDIMAKEKCNMEGFKNENEDLVDQSHYCQSPQECIEHYNEWSKNYDEEVQQLEFRGAKLLAEVCYSQLKHHLVDQNCQSIDILDIGVGSGKVGQLLFDSVTNQFGNEILQKISIDGVDGSSGMLALAKKQEPKIYRQLFEEILLVDEPSAFLAPESYDIVMGVGVFSPGHMSADHISHFVVPAKKNGGLIIFGVRETWLAQLDLESKLKNLEEGQIWRLVEKISMPNYRKEVPGIFFVYQRL